MTVGIAPRYAKLFGLTSEQAHTTYKLRVRKATEENFRKPAARKAPLARPAASEPTAPSGGTVAGAKPDLQALPAFDMSIGPSGHHLRFSATVWNGGDSPMVVDGFRRPGEDVMDAYQYFFDADGNQTGYEKVGQMEWHAANHQHWHFHDFARYRLLKADKTNAVRSKKESFCLANTDAVDYTVPGADWNAREHRPEQRLRRPRHPVAARGARPPARATPTRSTAPGSRSTSRACRTAATTWRSRPTRSAT